jgi:biotin carboxyl carrier protein
MFLTGQRVAAAPSGRQSQGGSVTAKMVLALLLTGASGWSSACVEFTSRVEQGAVLWSRVAPGASVSLDGEALDVMADGSFFLGFGRDAPKQAMLVVSEGSKRCEQLLQVEQRDYKIQRVEGVPAETVNPPPERMARIAREGALVKQARSSSLARDEFISSVLEAFVWPVQGPISGVYGSQRYYNGQPKRPHYGVDVAVPTGTVVRAPAAGVVTLAEPDLFYSGGTVILDHGYKLSSSFLHLSKVLVQVGAQLQAGDILGEVGATGRVTGPHLDWRMNWRDRRVDPQLLVPPMPKP